MAVAARQARAHVPVGGGLRTVDRLVLVYVVLMSIVAAARVPVFPQCAWLLVADGLMVALVLMLTRAELGPFGRLVRDLYPLVLLLALYASLDVLNGGGRIPVHDGTVQHWEEVLFGGQPSRDWWQRAPSRFWSTVLHGAYCSYYAILVVPALVLLRRADREGLRRFVLAVIAAFLTCYGVFVFFPVAGPYYAFPRPTGSFVDNPMARLVYAMLAGGSSYGAAFPSSHVAASVAATLAAGRAWRPLGWVLLVLTTLLTVAVVYCQMHYAVDALAGLVVGAVIGVWVMVGGSGGRKSERGVP
jgi:membrane-associated phospholipid phosphatase